jgi:hypothetical protein
MNKAFNRRRVTEMSDREYNSFKRKRAASLRMKNNTIKLVILIVSVLILTVSIKAITAMASNSDQRAMQKYYRTVSIDFDDTLRSIAEENFDAEHYMSVNDYLNEIMDINHISENSAISGGMIIYIPYYGEKH